MPTVTVQNIPILWEEPVSPNERKLVIWLPGFTDSKEGVRLYLRELAMAGYIALSLDPVDHGERSQTSEIFEPKDGSFRSPSDGKVYRHFWSIVAETSAEIPTVIDWAIAKWHLDAVGIGGISMGGNIAVVAAGLDQRIAVVAAALAEADWLRPGSIIPISAPTVYVQACYEQCNPLTNLALYQHCPALLFQCGADDQLIPLGGVQRFMKALATSYSQSPEKLALVIEDGITHEFTNTMWSNSLRWFTRFL